VRQRRELVSRYESRRLVVFVVVGFEGVELRFGGLRHAAAFGQREILRHLHARWGVLVVRFASERARYNVCTLVVVIGAQVDVDRELGVLSAR